MFILRVSDSEILRRDLQFKMIRLILLAYTGHETAYTGVEGGRKTLRDINVKILENAVQAVERVCPSLQFWTLQTGGKV